MKITKSTQPRPNDVDVRTSALLTLALVSYVTYAVMAPPARSMALPVCSIAIVTGLIVLYYYRYSRQQQRRSQPNFLARQRIIQRLAQCSFQPHTSGDSTVEYFTHKSVNSQWTLTISRQPAGKHDTQYTIESTTIEFEGPHSTGNIYKHASQFYVVQTKRRAVEYQEQVVYKLSNGTMHAMDRIKPSRHIDQLPDDIIVRITAVLDDRQPVR